MEGNENWLLSAVLQFFFGTEIIVTWLLEGNSLHGAFLSLSHFKGMRVERASFSSEDLDFGHFCTQVQNYDNTSCPGCQK